jgi:hypothetical protein
MKTLPLLLNLLELAILLLGSVTEGLILGLLLARRANPVRPIAA